MLKIGASVIFAVAGLAGTAGPAAAQDHLGAHGTQFPLTVTAPPARELDWVQQQKLSPSTPPAIEPRAFGEVVVDGDTALVGAFNAIVNGNANQGAVYVFTRDGDGLWSEQAVLIAPDGGAGDFFGTEGGVALHGDTAAIGAHLHDVDGNPSQGAVYIFVRDDGDWNFQTKLIASDGDQNDAFGRVALFGDSLLVGSYQSATGPGKAYIFTRVGKNWIEDAQLTASDGAHGAEFGFSVALHGETAVIGARHAPVDGDTNRGAAYVFENDRGNWIEQAKLIRDQGTRHDTFGNAVAIHGETVVVGARAANVPPDIDPNQGRQGAAHVFVRSGEDWVEQAELTASDGGSFDFFGHAVSLQGDRALVGSHRWEPDGWPGSSPGAAYIFERSGDDWQEITRLNAADQAATPWLLDFGRGAALNGDTVLVGAPGAIHPTDPAQSQGAVYVFEPGEPQPTLDPNPASIDFGEVWHGHPSAVRTVNIHNNGSGDLEIDAVALAGTDWQQFDLDNDGCTDETVAAGASCSIDVVFLPQAVGNFEAHISIESNAPTSPDSVPLQGEGMAIPPLIHLDPEHLDTALEIGQTTTENLTLNNQGDGNLFWLISEDPYDAQGGPIRPMGPATVPASVSAWSNADSFSHNAARADNFGEIIPLQFEPAGASLSITHSQSMDVILGNSLACTPDGGQTTTANQFLRSFTLTDFGIFGDFEITEVTFGVEFLDTAASIIVNLYTLEGDFTYSNLDLIGTESVELQPQQAQLVTVPVTATAPAASILVAEIVAPDLSGTAAFFMGSNNLGESAPSYIATPERDCNAENPVTFASLGAPHVHLTMIVTGTPLGCELPMWLDATPSAGVVTPGDNTDLAITFDATGLAAGRHDANLCIESNDPTRPLAIVPVTLLAEAPDMPELVFDHDSIDFGELEIGETSLPRTAILLNTGNADVADLVFHISGTAFNVDTSDCGDSLAAGADCEATVTFTPEAAGAFSETLQVVSVEGVTAVLGLTGAGIEPKPPEDEIFLDRFE